MRAWSSHPWQAALLAIAAAANLGACSPRQASVDPLRAQHQELERAKGVEQTIMKTDEASRKEADKASE